MNQETTSEPRGGWVKAMRTEDVQELIRLNPLAFTLAAVIAFRARWHAGFNRFGLDIGEAMLGDHESMGMTEQQYRTAKKQLSQWGFATFKPTNKGTVAKLTDTRLFVISAISANDQNNTPKTDGATGNQRTGNGQLTTNKECKNGIIKKPEAEIYKGAGAQIIPAHERPDGTPLSIAEVISYGVSLNIPEQTCRDWFEHVGLFRTKDWKAGLRSKHRRDERRALDDKWNKQGLGRGF